MCHPSSVPKKSHARPVPPAADNPRFAELQESGKRLNQVTTDFLKVDLETALTFAGIALQADSEAKRTRNRQSARKAYDTVTKLLHNVEPDEGDAEELRSNLQRLKSELEMLGEVF